MSILFKRMLFEFYIIWISKLNWLKISHFQGSNMGADQSLVEKNSDTLNELANEFVIKFNLI